MSIDPKDLKNYVIHVRKGYEDREESIKRQFSALGLEFEWILDFDIPELDRDTLESYGYTGKRLNPAEISCSMKHIRAWERIAADKGAGGFVFEDDVIIAASITTTAAAALRELESRHNGRGYISLGDGCAMFVPWTKREKGRLLYPAEQVRATDSYFLSREAAAGMIDHIGKNGFFLPADHLINHLCHCLAIPILWLEPTVVTQGSHTGRFRSTIQPWDRGGLKEKLKWRIKKFRRKYIYPLLGRDERLMSPELKKDLHLTGNRDDR